MLHGPRESLLVVGLQDLIASLRDLGPVLLQAGQNREIALIDDRTAELLHVARAGLLLFGRAASLLGLLGERRGRKRCRQQGESEEIFTHGSPSFWRQNLSVPGQHRADDRNGLF